MNKLYRLIFASILPFSIFAQDYAPFPNDSVFFESSIPNSDLMPVVKDPLNPDEIQKVNNFPNLSIVALGFLWPDMETNTVFMRPSNWMGYTASSQNELSFNTGIFGLNDQGFSETIKLDLDHSLLEKDTFFFLNQLGNPGETFYVEVKYDSLIETATDTIKQYSFQIMDSDYNDLDMNMGYELDSVLYNVNTQVVQISKHNGILKCPDFAYFPYCKQYELKGKVQDIMDLSTTHFEKIFKLDIGDEFHFKKLSTDYGGNEFYRNVTKKVCSNQIYDQVEQAYITSYDVWKRRDVGLYNWQTNSTDSGMIYATFQHVIDTIYLNDYNDLNIEVPNGFGATNDYSSEGYFYRDSSASFVFHEVYEFLYPLSEDTIQIDIVSDGGQHLRYYPEGYAHQFWDNTTVWGANYLKPVYVSTTDTTWGNPYSDAFLDIVENSTAELAFYIHNTTIIPPTDIAFQDFRIYDMSGKLLNYYKASETETGIDISQYENGAYILVAYDGKRGYHFKFIR